MGAEQSSSKESAAPPRSQADTVKKVVESQLKDYSWDQSEKFVKLYLTGMTGLDKCPVENIKLDFTKESVRVRVGPLSETANKIFTFSISLCLPTTDSVLM